MVRHLLFFFALLLFFTLINWGFFENLKNLPDKGFYIVIFAINFDLIVLIVLSAVLLRKLIKIYVSREKRIRKKLLKVMFLYLFIPILLVNLSLSFVLVKAVKSYALLRSEEILELSKTLKDEVLNLKNKKLLKDAEKLEKLSKEFRTFVYTRDIVSGIFVYFMVLLLVLTLLASAWASFLFARRISEPIERLSLSAKLIARGKLETPIIVERTNDEVEELSLSFKSMKEKLVSAYKSLKEEKELLDKILDNLPVGVLYLSKDGKVIRKNKSLERVLKEGKNVREVRVNLGENEVVIYEDITPVVLAERFKTWQEAVKRIAHEIKNPLTPVRLSLEMLYQEPKEEKFKEVIPTLLREIDRIVELINRFRDLTLDKEFKPERVKLREILEEVSRLYPSLELKVEGDKQIYGDVGMLKEVFLNLINNSLEWGAKRVEVKIGEDSLTYRDDGRGIDLENPEEIFIPYYSKSPKGMGLGMALVKTYLERHGWKVEVLKENRGFTLKVYF